MFTALAVLIIILLSSGLGPGETIGAFILGAFFFLMFSAGSLPQLLPVIAPAAALLGGTLWAAGESRPKLRRRRHWAAAGALFALAWQVATGGIPADAEGLLDFFLPGDRLQTAAIAIGGTCAALAFRAAMGLLGLFFPPPEPDQQR